MHTPYGVKAFHAVSFTVNVTVCISEERVLIAREL